MPFWDDIYDTREDTFSGFSPEENSKFWREQIKRSQEKEEIKRKTQISTKDFKYFDVYEHGDTKNIIFNTITKEIYSIDPSKHSLYRDFCYTRRHNGYIEPDKLKELFSGSKRMTDNEKYIFFTNLDDDDIFSFYFDIEFISDVVNNFEKVQYGDVLYNMFAYDNIKSLNEKLKRLDNAEDILKKYMNYPKINLDIINNYLGLINKLRNTSNEIIKDGSLKYENKKLNENEMKKYKSKLQTILNMF